MRRKIYSCITIQKELEATAQKLGCNDEITFLDPELHSNPQKMHETLQNIIDDNGSANNPADEIVICVSGCGKATCNLTASSCNLVIPRTMDCIDILLSGSNTPRPKGAIFLTASWMKFMQASAICHEKLISKHGYEKAAEHLRTIYKGFTDFFIIDTGTYDISIVEKYIAPLIDILGGKITQIPGPYKILEKLVSGNYDEDIIQIPKGNTLMITEFTGLTPAEIK